MPNRDSNVKACPNGHKNWESFQKDEPIDETGIRTFEKKKVWYRRCRQCGYYERIEGIS